MQNQSGSVRELLRAPDEPPSEEALSLPAKIQYPSGRWLRLAKGQGEEDCLSVTGPDGRVELSVRFTSEGPVLSFDGAKLSLEKASELDLSCDRLTLRGRKGVELSSGGDLAVRGQGDVQVDGENVLINCDDRSRFHR